MNSIYLGVDGILEIRRKMLSIPSSKELHQRTSWMKKPRMLNEREPRQGELWVTALNTKRQEEDRRKAESRAGVCGEGKGRLAGAGETSQTSGPHGLSRAPGSRDMLSRRWGWRGALFYFWISPNQKNLGNYEDCSAETQTLPGWHRPVYK